MKNNILSSKIEKIETQIYNLERQKKILEMELFIFNYPFSKGDLLLEKESDDIYFFVKHDHVYDIIHNETEMMLEMCLIVESSNFIFHADDPDIWKPRILKCGNCSQDAAWRSESLDINQLQCQECGIVTRLALLIGIKLYACNWCNKMYPEQELSEHTGYGHAVCSSCETKKRDEWSKDSRIKC